MLRIEQKNEVKVLTSLKLKRMKKLCNYKVYVSLQVETTSHQTAL